MDRSPLGRLNLFLLLAFALILGGVLRSRAEDGILAVEAWSEALVAASREAGLAEPYLLAGLVYAESRGRAGARSPSGARGLCQLAPETAAELGARYGVAGPLEQLSPGDNLRLGARYLNELLERWRGDVDLALLSYRLGPSRVVAEIEAAGGAAAWLERLRRPAVSSPWNYRTQVLRFAERFRERAAAGVGWP